MDIQEEKEAFLNVYVNYKGDSRKISFNEETEQFMWRKNNVSDTEVEYVHFMNQQWYAWLACAKSKAQAVPEWISVKDNLPPENILVLGMSQTPRNIFNIYNVMALDEFEEADVTHWMPLPDAPQEPAND